MDLFGLIQLVYEAVETQNFEINASYVFNFLKASVVIYYNYLFTFKDMSLFNLGQDHL